MSFTILYQGTQHWTVTNSTALASNWSSS